MIVRLLYKRAVRAGVGLGILPRFFKPQPPINPTIYRRELANGSYAIYDKQSHRKIGEYLFLPGSDPYAQ